jgi:DNA-binding NarL/FixJ family response regulator
MTRVLLVDDDALVRASLSMMLDGADGITVVGEAADGDQVLAAVDAHAPDIVLMDLRDAAGQRHHRHPPAPCPAAAARGYRADHL